MFFTVFTVGSTLVQQINNDLMVVTSAYLERKNILHQNIKSVQQQDGFWHWHHLVVWDGITNLDFDEQLAAANETAYFLKVRYNHNDYGDYIRRFGTKLAIKRNLTAVTYLDADNYWTPNHWATVSQTRASSQKNIIISGRKLLHENGEESEDFTKDFFDTNTITLFGEAMKIGLLWGLYPREMSLIGDRIISKYIQTHFANDIAYTNEATVNYRYTQISNEKVNLFRNWYRDNYTTIADGFEAKFGFSLEVADT